MITLHIVVLLSLTAVLPPFPTLFPAEVGLPDSPRVQATQEATPCSSPSARAFDFWVGRWEVRRRVDGVSVGENTIRRILDGCVLHESYRTPSGYAGESFNLFDSRRGVWHQTWVDGNGLLLVLEGGIRDGVMVLEGETVEGRDTTFHRIQWNRLEGNPDRVRQHWERSLDGGDTWETVFDGLYLRKTPGPDAPPV